MIMQVNNTLHSIQSPTPQMQAADKLEQAFLEEMLKYCGPAARQGEFSGGAGEDQFNSFLTREYSARLADRLDLGFAAAMTKGPQA